MRHVRCHHSFGNGSAVMLCVSPISPLSTHTRTQHTTTMHVHIIHIMGTNFWCDCVKQTLSPAASIYYIYSIRLFVIHGFKCVWYVDDLVGKKKRDRETSIFYVIYVCVERLKHALMREWWMVAAMATEARAICYACHYNLKEHSTAVRPSHITCIQISFFNIQILLFFVVVVPVVVVCFILIFFGYSFSCVHLWLPQHEFHMVVGNERSVVMKRGKSQRCSHSLYQHNTNSARQYVYGFSGPYEKIKQM